MGKLKARGESYGVLQMGMRAPQSLAQGVCLVPGPLSQAAASMWTLGGFGWENGEKDGVGRVLTLLKGTGFCLQQRITVIKPLRTCAARSIGVCGREFW